MKYCPKQIKNQIISQRVIEMYKEKEQSNLKLNFK